MKYLAVRSSLKRLPFALALVSGVAQAWMPTAPLWNQPVTGTQLYAGALGGIGSRDGTGTNARVYNVGGLVTDTSGNLYFADSYNDTIRKFDTSANVTTIAGQVVQAGSTNGTGTAASFNIPMGMAKDSSGNLYVAEQVNNLIRKITTAGVVTTYAGTGASGSTNGAAASATFNQPAGIVFDSSGNMFVADNNNYLIRKITTGGTVSTFAGSGSAGSTNGTGTAASFKNISGITIDGSNNLYVADTYNHLIRKITSAGVVTTLAGTTAGGYANGTGTAAKFAYPRGVACDGTNVYVADTLNNRIRKIVISSGVVTTLAGNGNNQDLDGTGTAAGTDEPWSITYDSTSSSLYVGGLGSTACATCGNGSTIRKLVVSSGVMTTVVGAISNGNLTQGSRLNARFNQPWNMTVDSKGNMYVIDTMMSVIRKIATDGTVSTFAGNSGAEADGTGTGAGFINPVGITVDANDNLYVTDRQVSTIRKITTPGAVVTTIAGQSGNSGFTNGTGTAALFTYPCGIAADSSGNLFVADYYNSAIRKIVISTGVVTTFAGQSTGGETDGTGTAAQFSGPFGMAIDSSNNLYVTDQGAGTIRKITPAGVVTTFAGSAYTSGTTNGTGSAARFLYPAAIAVSPAGNVYVSDIWAYNVRKITPAGVTTTVMGVTSQGAGVVGTIPGYVSMVNGILMRGNFMFLSMDNAIIKSAIP